MELKQFRLNKDTMGGRLIKKIEDLCVDRRSNNFEIIVLVRGLLNIPELSIVHVRFIELQYHDDDIILIYPSLKSNEKVLSGLDAKEFYQKAFAEFDNIDNEACPIDQQKYLNQKIGGYWPENGVWVGFDNYSNTVNIEEFDTEMEAIKYANGILSVTKDGMLI